MSRKTFDVIEYQELDKNSFDDEKLFNLFRSFVEEYEPNDDSDVLNFVKFSYKRGHGEIIKFNNYVGLIQFTNGKQIQILPKIANVNDSNQTKYSNTKKILLKMLKCLKWKNHKILNFASTDIRKMNILEIFICMYINETEYLLKTGIKSKYIDKSENLNIFKGKLLVKENILYNYSNKERFYVSFDEFSQDCSENRIIKATLIKLLKISSDINNLFRLKKLLQQLDHIIESTNIEYDFNHITIDKNMKSYENIMEWSKVFMLNKSFWTLSGRNVSKSLLFPMNRVFEGYIAHHIKKKFGNEGWDVMTQVRKEYLFDNPQMFKLVPDIIISKNGTGVIIDTKWKMLVNNDRMKYGISQADMYQMYTYCKKYKVDGNDINHVYVLYPLSEDFNNNVLEFKKFNSSDKVTFHIFFIDLNNMERSMIELYRSIELEIDSKKLK